MYIKIYSNEIDFIDKMNLKLKEYKVKYYEEDKYKSFVGNENVFKLPVEKNEKGVFGGGVVLISLF